MIKLDYKLEISGTIAVETGLHIGGSESGLDIGGVDNAVIKIKEGENEIPYIPGSSLKGKLRTLLARYFAAHDGNSRGNDWSKPELDKSTVKELFGISPGKGRKKTETQLIIRDSYKKNNVKTEDKTENSINRIHGGATPRHLERVVKGAEFEIDMILDIYKGNKEIELLETIDLGFQLLKRDYLGGNGTRGYGKVDIRDIEIKKIIFNKDGSINDKEKVKYEFKVNKN